MWNKRRIKMDDIKYIRATSKRALKDSCLWAAKGDYAKAQELYDYYAKDMNLPDYDSIPPSAFTQIKTTASDLFSFINENQSQIVSWIDMVKSAFNSTPKKITNPLPSL